MCKSQWESMLEIDVIMIYEKREKKYTHTTEVEWETSEETTKQTLENNYKNLFVM